MICAVDLFCGAGGTSTGLLKAARKKRITIKLIAINHWRTAINSHSLNNPSVHHICEPVENIHPREIIRRGRLHILVASTECRFHSGARGGGPCNPQSRAQPWQLIRWCTDVPVDNLLMENVREIMDWGPLHPRTLRPIKSRKGEYFRAFIGALRGLGYNVEWRIQCAADFGDPTSRQRFMLIARRGPITWPEPTHGPERPLPWREALECIDFSLQGKSLFGPDGKPRLCANTVERIRKGLIKFGGRNAVPFLLLLNGTTKAHVNSSSKSLRKPMPTIVAGGNHLMLVEPFVIGQQSGATARSLRQPVPTVATAGAIRLVEPFLFHNRHHGGHDRRCLSLKQPLPTVTAAHRGEIALCEPMIVNIDQTGGNSAYVRTASQPLTTIVSKQSHMLVQAMLVKSYRTGIAKPLNAPLDTVTTKDRFQLVECIVTPRGKTKPTGRILGELDIRTRLLQPSELSLAHSFPRSYKFTGSKEDQTTQIGNSVPVELAAAHASSIFAHL